MKRKPIAILPLASALGALSGSALTATEANSAAPGNAPPVTTESATSQTVLTPNTLVSTGETLLGFTMTEQADGTIVAQHVSHESHSSHASHASHRSHYSSS